MRGGEKSYKIESALTGREEAEYGREVYAGAEKCFAEYRAC